MQAYSDPTRESDEHALPDVEVFYNALLRCPDGGPMSLEGCGSDNVSERDEEGLYDCLDCGIWFDEVAGFAPGYYWWSCFPGCMPDGEATGPFDTQEAALADAQNV